MATTVSAIYEDGVLRLLAPLPLPEHTPVEVTVDLPSPSSQRDARDRIRAALVVAGLSQPASEPWAGPPPLSAEERAALAQQIPAGRPLSQIIDEEREGR
jgi:predicted DNA-binding antitoxin AbrB/MazE fold protein